MMIVVPFGGSKFQMGQIQYKCIMANLFTEDIYDREVKVSLSYMSCG